MLQFFTIPQFQTLHHHLKYGTLEYTVIGTFRVNYNMFVF